MRVRTCVVLCWLIPAAASAQVSMLCRTPADAELARTLARLIGEPVEAVEVDAGDETQLVPPDASAGEWVSIDRARATIVVHSVERQVTLSRALDADVVRSSSYAVALATAELLEWIETSPRDRAAKSQIQDTDSAADGGGLSGYGLGADLDVQTQPGSSLSFVRPAVYGELAWGRATRGAFWTLGARATIPGTRTLQVEAPAAPGARAQLDALGTDAVLQLALGHGLGQLALTAQLAAGISYLRLEAFDSGDQPLGRRDQYVSPLFAAGVGFRYSVLFGFAFSVRAEAQWAVQSTVYKVDRTEVLEAGSLRIGLLAGLLWESARAR